MNIVNDTNKKIEIKTLFRYTAVLLCIIKQNTKYEILQLYLVKKTSFTLMRRLKNDLGNRD